jgi:hypothetical protein
MTDDFFRYSLDQMIDLRHPLAVLAKRCIPYEFGVKVGLAMTLKGNLIVGARSFPGMRSRWCVKA